MSTDITPSGSMLARFGLTNWRQNIIYIGFAVIFVLTITVPVNHLIHAYLLEEGALAWAGLGHVDLSFLALLNFIGFIEAEIAAMEDWNTI